MNRTDRLMAIVWLLRSRQRMTAAQLGETFGVTVRTIYRDIEALSMAGVPVVALPGIDGGYELASGYRVSPLAFKSDEVEALWVAGLACSELGLPALNESLQSALDKIAAVASPEKVEQTRRRLAVRLERRGPDALQGTIFDTLRQAVVEHRTVCITYTDIAGASSQRMVTPERLLFQLGAWYIQGPDSRSGETRTFRIDRIQACEVTDEPPVVAGPPQSAEEIIPIRIRMAAINARWYREHPVFRGWEQTEDDQGCVLLQVPRSGLSSLLATVLSFGGQEVVVEPQWVIDRLVETAKRTIAAHETP